MQHTGEIVREPISYVWDENYPDAISEDGEPIESSAGQMAEGRAE